MSLAIEGGGCENPVMKLFRNLLEERHLHPRTEAVVPAVRETKIEIT